MRKACLHLLSTIFFYYSGHRYVLTDTFLTLRTKMKFRLGVCTVCQDKQSAGTEIHHFIVILTDSPLNNNGLFHTHCLYM